MQKNACASSPFFPHISTLCSSKRPAKKSDVCECTCFPFFFPLISVRCAVLKDPPQKKCDVFEMQKKTRALSFFSSYQYVVQFEKTRQKEWRIRSARTSLSLSSYYLNAKMEGTTTEPCWPSGLARRPPIREFLSSKPDGAKFLKKQNAKKRVENRGIMDLCSKLCHGFCM